MQMLKMGTLQTAPLIHDIVFAKLLGTMPQHFIGHAIYRATEHTRLYSASLFCCEAITAALRAKVVSS